MKHIKIIFSISALFLLFTVFATFAQEHEGHKMEMKDSVSAKESTIDLLAVDENEDGKVFECPMDWEVLSDDAGRCPKCEMKLKEYSLADVKKNLEKHGHKVKEHKMHGEHKMNMDKNHKNMESTIDVSAIDKNKDGKVYQCPMCAGQLSDEAGKCPTCDMELEENSNDDAKENLHKHGQSEKSHDEGKMKMLANEKCEYGCCS